MTKAEMLALLNQQIHDIGLAIMELRRNWKVSDAKDSLIDELSSAQLKLHEAVKILRSM